MARIKTYIVDPLISGRDIVIGSDADDLLKTKNYRVDSLRDYMLSGLDPETGGNLKITTIVDTSVEFLTPEDYFNNSVDTIEVLNYEIVFLILNGRTYIFRKNGDIYGVGEAQTVESDFTEIDITSVISANLQDLQSVLTEGNESILDAKINDLYLMDEVDGFGNIRLFGDNDSLNVNDLKNSRLFRFFLNNIRIFSDSGGTHFTIEKPSISANRTATLQNASGTIAYLSDIPTVDVLGIEEGDNISITETDGVYTISATSTTSLNCTSTELRDSVTNTTYFDNGGYFVFDSITSPINSIRIYFNENIEFINDDLVGVVYIHYKNGGNEAYFCGNLISDDITSPNCNIPFGVNYLDVAFPFEFISYEETLGISFIEITIYPNVIQSSSAIPFNGNMPLSITKYIADYRVARD
jgi:hypothetical protein